jgi:hypothetical protein
MRIERGLRSSLLVLVVAGLAAPGLATADDLYSGMRTPHSDWSLFAGATYTDDATLLPNGPSDTIVTAGLNASLYRDTGRLKADIDGSARWEDYVHNTFEDHVLGSLVGLVSYALVPEHLTWVVQDTYGQLNSNPLAPTTPQNRINANLVSTGPDAYLRLGGGTGLQFGARYAQSNYQSNPSAPVDDHRLTGNLGLIHHLSAETALSFNVSASRIQYQVPGRPGYDQADLFVRYETRGSRDGLALDAGASELRQTGEVVRDPLLRLTFYRRLTPSWNLNLSASSTFQNTATAFQSALSGSQAINGQVVPTGSGTGSGLAGGSVADVIQSQSAFRAENARIAFDFVRPRTTFDINGNVERDRYQFGASDLDRNVFGVGASFSRRLQPSLSVRLSAAYDRRSPLGAFPADRTTYGDAALDWRAGAMLGVTLAYHHEDRSADAGGFAYQQHLVYLGLTYGPPKRGVSFEPPGKGASGPASR